MRIKETSGPGPGRVLFKQCYLRPTLFAIVSSSKRLPVSHGNRRKLELLNQTITAETGTKPRSSAPDVQQIWSSLCNTYKDAKPCGDWSPGKGRGDKEREEDTRVTASWATEPTSTSTDRAACTSPVREGTSSGRPRTAEKNNLGFALLVKWADSLGVLMYWLMSLTSSVLGAYMLKGQELQINKLLIQFLSENVPKVDKAEREEYLSCLLW